jgi:hypothetical protein
MAPQREWLEKDYYEVLGVSKDASAGRDQEGLPQARPREPPGRQPRRPEAEQRFKDVGEAYASSATRPSGGSTTSSAGSAPPGFGAGAASPAGFGGGFEGGDLGDLLGHLFGSAGRRRAAGFPGRAAAGRARPPARARPARRRPPDLRGRARRRAHHPAGHRRRRLRHLWRLRRRAGDLAAHLHDLRRPRPGHRRPGPVLVRAAVCDLRRSRPAIDRHPVHDLLRLRPGRQAAPADRQDPRRRPDGAVIRVAGRGGPGQRRPGRRRAGHRARRAAPAVRPQGRRRHPRGADHLQRGRARHRS